MPSPQGELFSDWGAASEPFDAIADFVSGKDLTDISEAQTRFDVIDRIIREVLGWSYGQVSVEERDEHGYIDYTLRSGDLVLIVEAKKAGAAFPSPTKRKKLKLSGSVLGRGPIASAINQAEEYASSKDADVVVVTNGHCWCFYPYKNRTKQTFAHLVFPFDTDDGAELLHRYLAEDSVENGSLGFITTGPVPTPENRLLSEVHDADARVDRNRIADHITPALDNALYADALLNNKDQLEACFVLTEARARFDKQLGMHLADPKPSIIEPAQRIKRRKNKDPLKDLVEDSYTPTFSPPLTLIIGSVGAGKSTYLKHFELISGSTVLSQRKARWIYIDFEAMGRGGNPRHYMYARLKDYLLDDHSSNPIDYKTVIEPAYKDEVAGLARGPYNILYRSDKSEFDRVVQNYIIKDLESVEPYVEKVFSFLSQTELCVIVLDNIDLYEDSELEKSVFSEGLALSKKIRSQVIVSIRDKTFVKHRNDSSFDAFELRKLWLDPPPLESVLAKRLKYSQKILKGKSAKITLQSGSKLVVPDLSVFFQIVQSSVLGNKPGEFIASLADLNIRRGLELLTNFLTSGHIRAEEALRGYMQEQASKKGSHSRWFNFPFHEVFKGCILGQWKHYKETRSLCVNIFDSYLGSQRLRLLRLYILRHLSVQAKSETTLEVRVLDCINIFSKVGASQQQIIQALNDLQSNGLIRNNRARDIDETSVIVITRSGGYYDVKLSKMFSYVELCLFDTAIEDTETWQKLADLTRQVEKEPHVYKRMRIRQKRVTLFLTYLEKLEEETLSLIGGAEYLVSLKGIKESVTREVTNILEKIPQPKRAKAVTRRSRSRRTKR